MIFEALRRWVRDAWGWVWFIAMLVALAHDLAVTFFEPPPLEECHEVCSVLDMEYLRTEDCECICWEPVMKREEVVIHPRCLR